MKSKLRIGIKAQRFNLPVGVCEGKSWLKTQHSKNKNHGIQSRQFMANRWRNNGNSERLFSWATKSLQMVMEATKLKDICSLEEKL